MWLFWVLLFVALCHGQTSYSTVKQGTVLNALNTIRQYTVDFDEELYVVEATSCPDFTTTNPITCEMTCNYASTSACGTSTRTGCTCADATALCAQDFTELQVGASVRVLQTASIQRFRVFLPAYLPYRVSISSNNLGAVVSASTSPFNNLTGQYPSTLNEVITVENGHWVRDMMFTAKPSLDLCPSDEFFQPGTWYITSACWGPYTCDYAVVVEELPLLAAGPTTNCAGKNVPAGYTCVEGNTEYTEDWADHTVPLLAIYYPPAGACPNLFGFSVKTGIHSFVRAELATSDLGTSGVQPFYDSQTEVGSVWTAHSLPCDGSPIYMRITFDWTETTLIPVTIFITSTASGFVARPISELFALEYAYLTSGASYLDCPDVTLRECNSRKLTIAYDYAATVINSASGQNVDYRDFTCSRAVNHPQPAVSSGVDVTNPFWPPYGVLDYVTNARQVESYPIFTVASTTHLLSVLLDSTTSKQQTVYYNDTWISDQCQIKFTGILTTANFGALPSSVSIGQRPVVQDATIGECDASAINQIDTLLKSYRAAAVSPRVSVTSGELFTTAFLADAVAFSDQWVDCFNWLNSNLNTATYGTIDVDVVDYLELFPTVDRIHLNGTTYQLNSDAAAKFLANCDVECASSFMEELNVYKAADKCSAFEQTLDEFLIDGMSFIEKCIHSTYYPTHSDMRSALSCQIDGQCPEGTCNTFTHQCVVFDMSIYNSAVAACIVAKAPTYLLGQMFPGFYSLSETAQAQLILDSFTAPGCAPVNNWNAAYYDSYRMGLWCEDECGSPDDAPIAFTPYPLQLSDICKRSSCSLDIKFNAFSNVGCDDVTACSDARYTVDECSTAPSYCGLCEGPGDCRPYTGVGSTDAVSCAATQICINHAGEIINDLGTQDCTEDLGACYIDSPKGFGLLTLFPVANSNDCIQVSLQMELIWYTGLPGYANVGLCYFPQAPPAIPCNRYNGIPISSGCLILDMTTQDQCESFTIDRPSWYEGETDQTVGNYTGDSLYPVLGADKPTWLPADSFSGTSGTYQCVIDFFDINGLQTSWAFPKNSTECAKAGGKFVPAFKTLGTVWIPGVLRAGQWVKPAVVPLANTANLFSYRAFNDAVQTTLSQLYFVDQSAPSICRLESPISSLSSLLLQCIPKCVPEDTKQQLCPIDEEIYLSRATLCSSVEKSFTAYPIAVTALESSLPLGVCNELTVFLIPRSHFAYIVVPVFTSPFYIDPNVGDYQYPYVSVNYHNAVVGNVVSDGIFFEATAFATNVSTAEIPDVELCVTPTFTSVYQDQDFPGHFDFALLAADPINTIQPLGLNLTSRNDSSGNIYYCAFIDLQVGDTYFLVHVQHDWWADEEIDYMNTGQEVYFLLIGAFYFLLFLPFAYFTYKYHDQFTFYIYFSVATCLLWRSIHLLVVGGSRGTISSPFLSEPPFFFYFYILACYGVFYYVLWKHAMDKKKFAMTFRVLALTVAFFLFSICLVVCIVATTETVDSPLDSRFFTCYLRIDNGDIYWTSPQIISVAYFCLLLVLALIISAWKMYTSVSLSNKLHGKTKLNSREKAGNQFIMAAFILSISMVIQAILILTLGLITGTRAILWLRLTMLYFFELTPLLFLLWKVIFAPSGSGSTTSRGATGSKKTGATSDSTK